MPYIPNQILGTFLRDGERLTGAIRLPAFTGRLVFTPKGDDGRLDVRVNNRSVGYALPEAGGYRVCLYPGLLPQGGLLRLIRRRGVYFLTRQ